MDSLYIHKRGFTTTTTNSHQPSLLPLPRRAGLTRAPWAFAQTPWATPPHRGHKAKFAPCETPPGWTGLVLKLDSIYIYIGGVSHHHPLSIITYSPARTSARERTTPRERNWSPAPPRRASGQLPHGRTSQPTRQECSDHSSLGCCCSSLPSFVRPSVMPDASWLLTEGRKPSPRPMEQLSAPVERRQCGVGWRGSQRAGCVSAAC